MPGLIGTVDKKKNNGFELLYCERNSKFSKHPVNKRRPFDMSVYPNEQLRPEFSPETNFQTISSTKASKKFNKMATSCPRTETAKENAVNILPAPLRSSSKDQAREFGTGANTEYQVDLGESMKKICKFILKSELDKPIQKLL